jgi:hypothetical protein
LEKIFLNSSIFLIKKISIFKKMSTKGLSFSKKAIFLIEKMFENRKIPSERDILERLNSGQLGLPPLTFQPVAIAKRAGIDMIVETAWKGQQAVFAVECKASSTPRMLHDAAAQAKAYAERENLEPLVVVPFLSSEALEELEREGINGIDLCGNGVVVVPGKLAVYRTGARNRFRSSAPIKNIYQKNSSIVGRVFLARPRYGAVMEIQSEINRRSLSPISLATVSKALKAMEEDLLVSRSDTGISLIQPDKLLEKLATNFTWKRNRPAIRTKVPADGNELFEIVLKAANELKLPLIATGSASVSQYAVMQRGSVLSVYCTKPEALAKQVGGISTDRFPNVEVFEANESSFYFDAQAERGFRWASPVQVYLELIAGDKRDRETAEQVRNFILSSVRSQLE